MKITQIRNGHEFTIVVDQIYLTLDNGNELLIHEVDSGVLSIENVSNFEPRHTTKYGLMVTPQNYSTVHIIPEG